jgi:hypothetical protein
MTDADRADALARYISTPPPSSVTENTSQELIVVTRDKVELALRRNLPRYVTAGQVLTALGLTVALVTTLVTTTFQPFMGVDAELWRGIFVAGAVASVVFLVRDVVRIIRRPKLDDLVESIARDARAAVTPD